MNENIKKLWRQVELQECDCGCNPDEFLRLKFAELIIKECAEQAYREELTVEEGMMRYRRILEHFGVEE